MRKKLVLLLLLKLSGLWLHNVLAQSQLSFENYYSMGTAAPLTIMPVASYQTANGFYAEGRYNYEDLNTVSVYLGRTFSNEAKVSYSISPIVGAVIGQFNGGSVGANISLGYKDFFLYSQPQYTFAAENSINNYIYSWTDISYSPLNWLSLGVSLQHTKPKKTKGFVESGFVIEAAYQRFTFPVYIFNPLQSNRTFTFGANFELNFRKKKALKKESVDPFKESYPINILAGSPEEEKERPAEVRPAAGSVIKVRRVNVAVQTRTSSGDNYSVVAENNITSQVSEAWDTTTKKETPSITKRGPTDVRSANIKKQKESFPIEPAQLPNTAAEQTVLFALLLGPFDTEADASIIKNKLAYEFRRDAIVYSDGKYYKLRIPGFAAAKEAEMFNSNAKSAIDKAAAVVVPYKMKSVGAVPLKSTEEPFEASKIVKTDKERD